MNLIYCLAKKVTGDIRHSNQSNVAESKMLKDWSHTSNAGEFSPAGSYFIHLIHSFRRTVQIVPLESGLECSLVSPAWKPDVKVKKWWLGARASWPDWSRLAWPKPLATQSPTLAGNFWGSTGTHKASEAQLSPWTVCCEWDDFKKSRAVSVSARQVLRRMSWANLFQGLLGNGNPIWMEWLLFNKMFNLKKFPQRALSMSA